MTLANISHPKAIGFYLNRAIPSELEDLDVDRGESLSLYSALILCEVAASAAASAMKCKLEDGSGQYYFGTALINLYPEETPDFSAIDALWNLSFDCQGWLEFLAWCHDLASCRLRDSRAQ